MSIIWAESFDFYGTSTAAFALRGYIVGNETSFSTTARTGTRALATSGATNDQYLRKILDNPETVLGIGCGFRPGGLSTSSTNVPGFKVGGARWGVNNSLGITVVSNAGAIVGQSANNILTTGTYFWIESKFESNGDGTGNIEVRVNGATVVAVNGLSMGASFTEWRFQQGNNSSSQIIDDLVIWNDAGTLYNDFVGDRRCFTSFPNADETLQEWTPSTGTSGFAMIDESTPSDTDYVEALANGDISEFEKDVIGINTNDIAAVQIIGRALKDDTGPAGFRLGINSNGVVQNSQRFLPNTTVTYFDTIIERDPNGSIAWTKTAVDAATVRITRDDP